MKLAQLARLCDTVVCCRLLPLQKTDVVQLVNGKADWNCDWDAIAKIAKSFGFAWGGDWKKFKDKPHFEMTFGNTLSQLRNKIKAGKIKDGYVILI